MSVKVSLPCSVSWSEMEGGERERHCSGCERKVQNYSLLSPGERQAMAARAKTQRVCAFGLGDGQGRLRTREELSAGALRWLRARARAATTVAAMGLAVQPTALAPGELSEAVMDKARVLSQAGQSMVAEPALEQPAPERLVAKVRKLEAAQVAAMAEVASLEDEEFTDWDQLRLLGYIDIE